MSRTRRREVNPCPIQNMVSQRWQPPLSIGDQTKHFERNRSIFCQLLPVPKGSLCKYYSNFSRPFTSFHSTTAILEPYCSVKHRDAWLGAPRPSEPVMATALEYVKMSRMDMSSREIA